MRSGVFWKKFLNTIAQLILNLVKTRLKFLNGEAL